MNDKEKLKALLESLDEDNDEAYLTSTIMMMCINISINTFTCSIMGLLYGIAINANRFEYLGSR